MARLDEDAPLIPVSERDALKKALYKMDARRKGKTEVIKKCMA